MRFAGDAFIPDETRGEAQKAWERAFEETQRMVEKTPAWQLNPQDPNLIHHLPTGTSDELIRELQNPMRNTGMERELFNNLLNPRNPAPVF